MGSKNQKGFTLIELILVIVILGILAVSALPTFTDINSEAGNASMDGVVGSVRSAIGIYFSNRLATGNPGAFPAAPLDGAAAGACTGTGAAACFSNILTQGVTDSRWSKVDDNNYTYTNPDGTPTTFTYDENTGLFQ